MLSLTPAALLLLLLATANAALAHVFWGRHWSQIFIYWLASLMGCLLAYAIGYQLPLPLELPVPAGVPVLEAVLAAWILIIIASRLRV